MTKKKLGIFITRMIRGGAQKVVLDLLTHLDREKYDLSLIVGKTPDSELNYLGDIPDDVKLITCDYIVREISPFKDFFGLFKLKKLFKQEKFDILHLHTSKAGVLGSLAGNRVGIKNIVYTPHGHIFGKNAAIPGFSELSLWKRKLLFHLRRFAYSKCNKLVALSEADLKEQVDLKLAPAEKFTIIMNGIDIPYYTEKIPPPVDVNSRIIGAIGRLSREKGHDVLIEAFSRLVEAIPDVRLFIVGDGPEKDNLVQLTRSLGIQDKVSFTGMIDDVRGYLQMMEVFVLPSRYESQGLVIMEAMASGVPVVASNVGGVPGIVENGESGLLVPPDNAQKLGEGVIELLNNKTERKHFIANSLQKSHDEFRIEKMIMLYEELYENISTNS